MLAFPPAIQPAHRTALEALAADLRTEFDDRFVGLVIGGSVGAGTASPSSDIDAFVLVDVPWRQRRRRTVAGVAVDLFLDPPEQVMRAIVRERAAVLIENYAAGWIAYDPMGRAQALCAQARPRFARGRRPLNPAERFTSRLRCDDLIASLARALDEHDPLAADYASALLASAAVEIYYLVRGRWDPPPKRRMGELERTDPAFADALRSLLQSPSDGRTRLGAARSLIAQLFGDDLAAESDGLRRPIAAARGAM